MQWLYKRSLPNSRLRKGTIYRDYLLGIHSKNRVDMNKCTIIKLAAGRPGPGLGLVRLGTVSIILPAAFSPCCSSGPSPWTGTRGLSRRCHFARRFAATLDRLRHVQPLFLMRV